jgi:hypothetical protein
MGTTLVGVGAAMTGLGVSILTSGGLGTSGGFTTTILGSCISILGTSGRTGGGGGGGGNELGLDGLDLLGDDRLGEFGEQMAIVEGLFGRGADDDEDEENDQIDDQGDEDRWLALAAGVEDAEMGKLNVFRLAEFLAPGWHCHSRTVLRRSLMERAMGRT